ncbi:MAG: DUF4238 domain-containing protein [Bdellovibrionales bacterium]
MKCHFVPQSYLRRFLNSKNLLECFDLFRLPDETRTNSNPAKPKATKSTAQLEDWYVLKAIDQVPSLKFFGEKRIEEDFQRLFENDLTLALNRLEGKVLTPEDKETIANFMAFQLHRAPISRKYYQQAQATDLTKLTDEEKMKRNAEIIHGFIGTAISALTLAPFLKKSKWVLIHAEGTTPFITSDNPVNVNGHPKNMSRLTELKKSKKMSEPENRARRTAYIISVSPAHALYINTSQEVEENDVVLTKGRWDSGRVQQYNDLVFRSCLSCVYSNDKNQIENYVRRFQAGEISQDLFVDNPWGV